MIRVDIAVSNPVVCLPGFYDTDVAASQTNAQLPLASGGDGFVAVKAGYIDAIAATLSDSATAGSMTIGATIGGTEKTETTQTVTTGTTAYATFQRDGVAPRFAAGDTLGIEITTSAAWDGTTADLDAQLYVVYEDFDF